MRPVAQTLDRRAGDVLFAAFQPIPSREIRAVSLDTVKQAIPAMMLVQELER